MIIDKKKFMLALANKKETATSIIAKAGVSIFVITSINQGRKVRPLTVGKLAAALDVPVETLLEVE